MELGSGSLRRDGVNVLKNALHPVHGLAWTDGTTVYLSPPFSENSSSKDHSAAAVKLGSFEGVSGLLWSCDIIVSSSHCFLCVIHTNSVSIWCVKGKQPDLNLRQVRRINASPIPQGCLWNPHQDILCLLNPSQCCFYFRHASTKGSYSFPVIDSGRITCGCWSKDGKRLVVAVKEIILIYQWVDIEKSISDYNITAWRIPSVEGTIRTLVSISDHQMACTTELPLDQLCKSSTSNLFETPDFRHCDSDSVHGAWESNSSKEEIICKSQNGNSHLQTLLNLKRNTEMSVKSASSQLLVFAIPKSGTEPPSKMTSENLPGMLVPDVLFWQSSSGLLAVGSNAYNSIYFFSLQGQQLVKINQHKLNDNQRLKGLCSLPSSFHFLALIGSQSDQQNHAFPSSSPYVKYDLMLKIFPVNANENKTQQPQSPEKQTIPGRRTAADIPANLFKEIQLPNRNSRVHLLRFNTLYTDQHFIPEQSMSPSSSNSGESDKEINLLLPGQQKQESLSKISKKSLIIDDDEDSSLELERADFSDSKPTFQRDLEQFQNSYNNVSYENITVGKKNNNLSVTEVNQSAEQEADGSLGCHSNQPKQVTSIEQQISAQGMQIGNLQKRIDEIAKLLNEAENVNGYKEAHSPDLVFIVYRDLDESFSDVDGETVKKAFMLDLNRLQLETIKLAFGLSTVELYVGGTACVLSANTAGYIPLIFKPNETYFITGRKVVNSASTYC